MLLSSLRRLAIERAARQLAESSPDHLRQLFRDALAIIPRALR
jgi:hypothetical protein